MYKLHHDSFFVNNFNFYILKNCIQNFDTGWISASLKEEN